MSIMMALEESRNHSISRLCRFLLQYRHEVGEVDAIVNASSSAT